MTDLNDILAIHSQQDECAELAIVNPLTGEKTDLVFWIAGPDSNVQRAAKEWAEEEVRKHPLLRLAPDLPSNVAERRRIATELLARTIVCWDIRQDGKPVPLTVANAARILEASDIIREQVDQFAASRDPWRPKLGAPNVAA